jgi:hypothetical protein
MSAGRALWFSSPDKGNPLGLKNISTIRDELIAEFAGVQLSAIDRTMLEQAARLLVKSTRTRNADSQAACTNTAMRIVDKIKKAKGRRRMPAPSVDEMTARMAAR